MSQLLSTRSRVVIAAFLTQAIILGGMFSYGVFLTELENELGWSRTVLSASSSLAFLIMGIFAIAGGRLNDRFGPRWVLSVTGALTGLGYILMSGMTAPWQLVLWFGLFIGIGLSTHDVATLSTVASWFDRRRGAMTGVVKTGAACGQMVVPILVTALIAVAGWREALLTMGVLIAVSLVLAAQWMQPPPPNEPSGASDIMPGQSGYSFAEARQTHTMWTLCGIQFCFFPALFAIPLHLVAHAKDLGMTTESAATVLSLVGGSSIIGRLLIGLLIDRIGGKSALIACLLPLLLVLSSLLVIDRAFWLFLFAPVYGIAHGGLFTVVSPTIAEFFGLKAHGAIFGTVLFFGVLGGAAGPLVAGIIFDQTGSYQPAFMILVLLTFCGLILSTTIRPG